MFHVSKARLDGLARRIVGLRIADDLDLAARNGWTATPTRRGGITYCDPRFDQRKTAPVPSPVRQTWVRAAFGERIRTLSVTAPGERRCS